MRDPLGSIGLSAMIRAFFFTPTTWTSKSAPSAMRSLSIMAMAMLLPMQWPYAPEVTNPTRASPSQIGSNPAVSASSESISKDTSFCGAVSPSRSRRAASRPMKSPLSKAIQRSINVMPGV